MRPGVVVHRALINIERILGVKLHHVLEIWLGRAPPTQQVVNEIQDCWERQSLAPL